MNTSRTYSAVKEQVKAKFSWKYAGGALGVAVVVLLLSLVQPWSTTSYELSDSGVWVSKGPALGRVNSQVAQMDYVGDEKKGRKIQESAEAGPILVQGGRSVFLVADGGDSIEAPKPQEPTADQKPLAIPGVKELALGGGTGNDQVVVARTESEVFLVARGGALLRSKQPLMKVGPKSQVAVGSGGTVVAYSPQDGKKEATLQYRELGSEDVRNETLSSEPGEGTTVTMVGEQVVILDADAKQLLLPGSDAVKLNGLTSPKVQLPGPQSDFVVIADKKELLKVNLKSGERTTIYSADAVSTPVRPAVDADCVHGAWERVVVASCGGGEPMKADLNPAEDAGPWYFRTGGVTALLNNLTTGNSWMVFDQNELKKVLWPKSEPDKERSEQEEETPPDRDQKQQPKAICEKEGELGARKGKVTYLNVLANDKDQNRDPILVSKVRPTNQDGPKFEIAQGGRSIQIDTRSATVENPTYEFEYEVSDGQEYSEKVKCEVRIVPAGQKNKPPKKLTEKTVLAFDAVAKQPVNYDLLAHFIDPEGDPIILTEALAEDPASGDKVSFDPTGFIYFTSAGKTSTVRAFVQDVPPDEQGVPAEWPVQARVAAEPKPPTARNDVVEVVVNETKTVQPLLNDSDPNGDELTIVQDSIKLVKPGAGLVILPTADDPNSFTLTASKADYYTLSYEVTDDNTDPVEGRITVKASPKDESSLVALNDVVIVNVGSTATVDLLANDSDASNGVLSVVDLVPPTPLQPPDPCSAPQLSGSVLNDFSTFQVVALDDDIAGKTCNFGYEITNSQGKKATAQISVVIVERKLSNEPPEFIHPETFSVRAKQVGVIPLGAFAQDPEGDPITVDLDPKDFQLPAGSGQIYQSGNDLKYVAPQGPLAEPVVVNVKISDQLRATTKVAGTIKIQVIQAPNIPPVPKDVTVRVRAGQEISIPVPLVGLDEDWTPMELTDWDRSPTHLLLGKPKILDGSQTISYLAPPDVSSTRTTKFRYFVKDTNGGKGSALVTVQISPRENNPPIAVLDKLTAQKGSPVWINPVSNDTDLDGDFLKLEEPYTAPPGCKAEPDEGRLKITAESNCTIEYHVSDYEQGDAKLVEKNKVPGRIAVTVVAQDFGLRPIARDDYATPDGDFAKVNVLANDEDPDGLASDLTIDFGDDSKSISDKDSPGTIKIERTKSPQRLQYSITDKQDLLAVAFVWVPSQDENQKPIERPNHDPITVKIGEPAKEIKLADYIIDPEKGELTFKDVSSNEAENGDELNKTLSQGTVMFKPLPNTAGLGGLQVTATDKGGISATIVLAIEIQPADNLKPSWINPNYCDKVLVEQGSKGNPKKSAQLKSLVSNAQDPDGKPGAPLSFEKISESGPEGVEVIVTPEGNFTASASDAAEPGLIKTVSVSLTDDEKVKSDEELKCSIVVGYTTDEPVRVRPGVQLVTKQGQAIKVEIASLLEQSGTGAKFVDTPSGQVGGTVQTSATTLTYTPGIDVAGDVNIPFTVKEEKVCQSTGLPCTATGNIVVLVTGRPTGLTPPTAVGGADSDATIVLTYKEPDRNSDPSPVTYSIRSVQGNVTKDCGTSLTCTVDAGDGVKNAIDYSFVLTAKNATGESKSLPSNPVQTDVSPDKPIILSVKEGDGQLIVDFEPAADPPNGISPTTMYACNGGSVPVEVSPDKTNKTKSCTLSSLKNGDTYKVTVTTFTKNASATSNESLASPFGPPIIDEPGLVWANSDQKGGMSLKASAQVDPNGRDVIDSTWTISCATGTKKITEQFSCPRKSGEISGKISVRNLGGTTEVPVVYVFPDRPVAYVRSVASRFKSVGVEVAADGKNNTGLYTQYNVGSGWIKGSTFSVEGFLSDNGYKDYLAPFQVRACSDQWPAPNCGEGLEGEGVVDDAGYGYGSAPPPECLKGSEVTTVDSFTCDLTWLSESESFIPSLTDLSGGVLGGTKGTTLTVGCGGSARVLLQYEGDPKSNSSPLFVDKDDGVPVCL